MKKVIYENKDERRKKYKNRLTEEKEDAVNSVL